MIEIIWGVYILVFGLCGYLLVRNNQVRNTRQRVADEISKYNEALIEKGTYETDKLEFPELSGKSPTYEQMVFKFLIPLKDQEERLRQVLGLNTD